MVFFAGQHRILEEVSHVFLFAGFGLGADSVRPGRFIVAGPFARGVVKFHNLFQQQKTKRGSWRRR